ncbi:MAG TPA: SDR family NAD(P)-dependent oxidoreductase [Streptosporangiaceae bacterium]
MTGASDGIGAAAARQLAAHGARVVLTGRSPGKTAAVAAELGAPYFVADFADLDQVRRLAATLASTCPRIDVLVSNAGAIFGARALTRNGFEQTFQVNHLAPFLLTTLLLPTLTASSASVLQTSSSAARLYGLIDPGDLQNEKKYSPNKAYGDAKLANILFTRELQRRYGPQGINAVAFNPGHVATNFARHTTSYFRFVYHTPLKWLFLTSPRQAAGSVTFLAEGIPGQTWRPGEFYSANRPVRSHEQAYDDYLARDLWDQSAAMLRKFSRPE